MNVKKPLVFSFLVGLLIGALVGSLLYQAISRGPQAAGFCDFPPTQQSPSPRQPSPSPSQLVTPSPTPAIPTPSTTPRMSSSPIPQNSPTPTATPTSEATDGATYNQINNTLHGAIHRVIRIEQAHAQSVRQPPTVTLIIKGRVMHRKLGRRFNGPFQEGYYLPPKPAAGAVVSAYIFDKSTNRERLIGRAITDSNGCYTLTVGLSGQNATSYDPLSAWGWTVDLKVVYRGQRHYGGFVDATLEKDSRVRKLEKVLDIEIREYR